MKRKIIDPYYEEPRAVLVVDVGEKRFYASSDKEGAGEEFFKALNENSPLKIVMTDCEKAEKVGKLPFELPQNDRKIRVLPGDILLYQNDQIAICFEEKDGSFTRLARMSYAKSEELCKYLGLGSANVEFYLEWSE